MRIHVIISEMLGAIEKAITDCEGQTATFKEENGKILCSATLGWCICTWVQ